MILALFRWWQARRTARALHALVHPERVPRRGLIARARHRVRTAEQLADALDSFATRAEVCRVTVQLRRGGVELEAFLPTTDTTWLPWTRVIEGGDPAHVLDTAMQQLLRSVRRGR